ncbi:DUF6482 family protein [Larsenimonas salina]|uniref:DUF6482 family protein n=1 Tax=Larsenimonas salina TaxID=1295565 RepID=UPI002072B6C9|nr:DUF6482 family protein [Larsenimonas salina]MCM5703929.1 DUF6482 family protein [Larsenimonas salina]
MEFQQFLHAIRHLNSGEVRVVSHMGSDLYQVELRPEEGESSLLKRRGKPQLFRSLDAVYSTLRHAGVHRAYLVKTMPHDSDDVARGASYKSPMTSHIPLVF